MKEIPVTINRTLRQQVTVKAHSEVEAVGMVYAMMANTNALDYLPDVSMGITIRTANTELTLPEEYFDPAVEVGSRREASHDGVDLEELINTVCAVRDEVEAALEHLDGAIYDLTAEDEE